MIEVIELNFRTKQERRIPLSKVEHPEDSDIYYWISIERGEADAVIPALRRLSSEPKLDAGVLLNTRDELPDIDAQYLAFALREVAFVDKTLVSRSVRIILGDGFIAIVYEEGSEVIREVMAAYQSDFVNFAKTPGFLLFEIADFISGVFQQTFREFETLIDQLQLELFEEVDDAIFFEVARTTRQLLDFRSAVVSAREAINVIATRKSRFVSENTQPFLERKVALLSRLSDDLAIQRAIISDTLNLYMGFVSYQTNKVINRLTVISVIFLPMTFLVGVYGMNFDYMPELSWKFSYLVFWIVVLVLVSGLLLLFQKKRWLDF